MKLTNIIRKPRTLAAVASLVVAGSALFSLAPTAGATSLREYPHFQCYDYTSGATQLVAERPKINSGQNYTNWQVVVYRQYSSGLVPVAKSRVQSQDNEDFSFGELTQENDTFNVARNSIYAVRYYFRDNTDSITQTTWATPIMNHYGAYTCST
jgi:hypothetical protein